MYILVTGHQGFIGKALYNELNEKFGKHYNIIGFDIKEYASANDIVEVFTRFLQTYKPDVIFHVGANSDTLEFDVNIMMTQNVAMSKVIADYCSKESKIVIYSSSASCYGNDGVPSTLYGWSKYLAELLLKPHGVALRYFNVYGYDESHKGKMASVAYQSYIKHKNGEPVKLFPLKPTRDFIYVKDVVAANIYAWRHLIHNNNVVFDVGTGQSRTFEDVLRIMQIPFTILNESEVQIPKNYQYYTLATNMMPGWKAEYPIELGLTDYLNILNKQ